MEKDDDEFSLASAILKPLKGGIFMSELLNNWLASQIEQHTIHHFVHLGAGSGELIAKIAHLPQIHQLIGVESSIAFQQQALQQFNSLPDHVVQPELQFGSLIYYDSSLKRKDAILLSNIWFNYPTQRIEAILNTILHDYFPKHFFFVYSTQECSLTRENFEKLCHKSNFHNIYKLQFDTLETAHPNTYHVASFTRKESSHK